MYETGQFASREELRTSLRRLEEALARHEPALGAAEGKGLPVDMLRHNVALLKEEAQRLRSLLAAETA